MCAIITKFSQSLSPTSFLGWTFLGWVGALVWSVMPVAPRTA